MEEAPYGRYFSANNALYIRLKYEVQRLYEERRRVLIELMTNPPDDPHSRLLLTFRLEELTTHLDALTEGLFAEEVDTLERAPWRLAH